MCDHCKEHFLERMSEAHREDFKEAAKWMGLQDQGAGVGEEERSRVRLECTSAYFSDMDAHLHANVTDGERIWSVVLPQWLYERAKRTERRPPSDTQVIPMEVVMRSEEWDPVIRGKSWKVRMESPMNYLPADLEFVEGSQSDQWQLGDTYEVVIRKKGE